MPRSTSQRKKTQERYRKIQQQFTERMKETTPSGARASSAEVIKIMAEQWCFSVDTIENIIRKKL